MLLSVKTHVPQEFFCGGTKVYDHTGGLVATVIVNDVSLLDKEDFDKIPDEEVFKVITTKLHTVEHNQLLKFVCKKGQANDWAIYYAYPTTPDYEIASVGNKVQSIENIKRLCPCTIEVLDLYRR